MTDRSDTKRPSVALLGAADASSQAPDQRWQGAARLALSAVLLALGLYIVSDYLRALAWALVFSVTLWPLYARVRRAAPPWLAGELLPLLFTVLTGFVFLLPVGLIAFEVAREINQLVDYGRQFAQSGVPAPDFLSRLPFGAPTAIDWWNVHLAHQGWVRQIIQQANTASNRELGRSVGMSVAHRAILFAISLLALFFLFRDGDAAAREFLIASHKLFGMRGERVARQMTASVHGTVNGLVLVGLGEGLLLGVVYLLTKLPHPALFAALTAVAAMIPFAAYVAIALAALVLLVNGGAAPAVIVAVAGLVVVFAADHFVRPTLIGGTTKLPFLWVLLGILGGLETFQLLGLFIGPAVMAALMLLWRELAAAE
jgi:predicted PurR-regulated permease PerM